MLKSRIFVVLLTAVAAGFVAHAQQQAPPRPQVKQHKFDLESSYIRMPLPPGEEKYGRIDGQRMKEHVHALTAIARKHRDVGERYWGRLPGSRADAEAEEYIATKFREFGLQNVHVQPISLTPQWRPLEWSFTAAGSGTTLTPTSIFPSDDSVSTPAGGLTLEIVWAGIGSELDFAGRDVKGRMVFLHSEPRPNGFQQTARFTGALQRAVQNGAAAVLVNVNIPGNLTNSFGAAPKVPAFSIGSEDGDKLKALMAKGPVTANLKLIAEERAGLKDNNVWGTLPGTTAEEIIITAHHDGVFEAAFDNASGVATMLGLAEYFSKVPQLERRRTIKFVSTAAHQANQQGANAIKAQPDLLKNAVLLINCEHTSVTQMNQFGAAGIFKTTATSARQWWINGSDRLASIVFDTYKKFGVAIWDDAMYEGGGIGPFSREMTSIQLIVSPVYYSSDLDGADVVPAPGLEAVARSYAKIIDATAALSRDELRQAAPPAPTSTGVSR